MSLRFASRLGWLCQPATLRCAQSVFCDVHAAAKNEFHFFRGLRAANSARHLFDRVTKTFAKNPDLRNFTLDNSRICTYNKKADCNDACVAQLVESSSLVMSRSPVRVRPQAPKEGICPNADAFFLYSLLAATYAARSPRPLAGDFLFALGYALRFLPTRAAPSRVVMHMTVSHSATPASPVAGLSGCSG